MYYKIFLINEKGSPRTPEGGQAVKVSIYEKDCSNEKLELNSFAHLLIFKFANLIICSLAN